MNIKSLTPVFSALTIGSLVVASYFWISSEAPSLSTPEISTAQDAQSLSSEPLQSSLPTKPNLIEQLTQQEQNLLLGELEFDERTLAFATIDLEALKNEYPDNLYWEMAAPTLDESVKQTRKEQREFWKLRQGKISSNLASEAEIREYYSYQNKLSEDYVELTGQLIKRHGQDLAEQDYEMITLATQLHLSRLQDMPSMLERDLKNRQRFLDRKNEWLADKGAYEAKLQAQREAALKELGKI